MKVEKTLVNMITITEAPNLDPITVMLNDIEPRRGRITIQCFDKSWTAYWGGMGQKNIAQFFISCHEDYIAQNLSVGIRSGVFDPTAVKRAVKIKIINERRKNLINADEAREQFDEIEDVEFHSDPWNYSQLMQKIFGDEWWYAIPEKPNPEYTYLCRIIRAVQDGLKMAETNQEGK